MIEQLRSVFESDPRVAYALIFGSSVTGKAHAHSDVDVAIGMAGPHQLDTMELGALASRLEAAAGRRVDLVLLDEAPPGLAYCARKRGPAFLPSPDRNRFSNSCRVRSLLTAKNPRTLCSPPLWHSCCQLTSRA
ncbi:MAG: hypothetical protein DMF96_30100 [Acidobacteria bacterium]|nr:MAG: hypothetical protein DMF96_30100 [Acidobacteriota bacterium]